MVALPNDDRRALLRWGRVFECMKRRTVGKTVVRNLKVSTVFLGLNHQYCKGGPPLIFETMVFGMKDDELQWRYSTLKQAQKGHAAAVRYAEGLPHLVKREGSPC